MADLNKDAVTLLESRYVNTHNKHQVSRRYLLNLTGQGGLTNQIKSGALNLESIADCSSAVGAGGKVYPAAHINNGGNDIIVLDDGTSNPADVTDNVLITVVGEPEVNSIAVDGNI